MRKLLVMVGLSALPLFWVGCDDEVVPDDAIFVQSGICPDNYQMYDYRWDLGGAICTPKFVGPVQQ